MPSREFTRALRGDQVPLDYTAPMGDPNAPRRFQPPLLDALGKLCTDGKQLADYLWQVPDDAGARQKILDILEQIARESTKQGRREMPRICEELKTAAKASPSPQQVDMLVNGFDRLVGLWQAPKTRLPRARSLPMRPLPPRPPTLPCTNPAPRRYAP